MSDGKWWDVSWNPIVGCTRCSPACEHCWALRMAATRLRHLPQYQGMTYDRKYTDEHGQTRTRADWTERRPRPTGQSVPGGKGKLVFVCDMSDLFLAYMQIIHGVFDTMEEHIEHTFAMLTKRPETMAAVFRHRYWGEQRPPVHIWAGVSVWDQASLERAMAAFEKLPYSTMRYISYEPALGPINLRAAETDVAFTGLPRWVIAGAETGPGARPANLDWFRDVLNWCCLTVPPVPFWLKQVDARRERELDGQEWNQRPEVKHD